MRIACDTVADFLENIRGAVVLGKSVYVNQIQHSLNATGSVREATSIEVGIQLSAVIQFDEEGEALVECGEMLATDRLTANGSLDGTERFKEILENLRSFCSANGLTIRPGVLGI